MIVIMCVWQRIHRLPITIRQLEAQTNHDFKFIIWNNNKDIKNEIDEIIHNKEWIEVIHSDENVGGIGRFYAAQKYVDVTDRFLFIDDDQTFEKKLIEKCKKEKIENKIKSWWAWRLNGSYWNRTRIYSGVADYCGTGGMLVDANLFKNDDVVAIPQRYQFIEDLWLSFYAKKHKYELTHLNVYISIIVDNKDQYIKLAQLKNEFYNYLNEQK